MQVTFTLLLSTKIADRWDETNWHSVKLRTSLVTPSQAQMILRSVQNDKIQDSMVDVWVVLLERPDGDGYIIFYDDARDQFGLASLWLL